jgi:hypothetical protein
MEITETLMDSVIELLSKWDNVVEIVGLLLAAFIAATKLSATKRDDEAANKADLYWNKTKKIVDVLIPVIATRKSEALKKEEAEKLVNGD